MTFRFVRSVDLNGGDRQMVVSGINLPWNTAIYENHVYWSSYGGIERADRFTGSNHQIVLNTTPSPSESKTPEIK